MSTLASLPTPSVLVDRPKAIANIQRMQAACNAGGVELRPHIKTHKSVEMTRLQLAAGAAGITCAKLGEAEAMLPSGVQEIFVAHSLVDPQQAPRVAALHDRLRDLRLAVTSEAHFEAFAKVAAATNRKLGVMLGVDTGLGREGVRSTEAAVRLAALIKKNPHTELRGLYCHEGHFYGGAEAELEAAAEKMIVQMDAIRQAIDPKLALWPGCSVTGAMVAKLSKGRVQAVRPGAYPYGDLSLSRTLHIMKPEQVAVSVLATVVDKPESGLALIDAGSKTFSSDRTPLNVFGAVDDGRDLYVARVNEEHGYLRGATVDSLTVGQRLRLIPAHVCTVINLTSEVVVCEGDVVTGAWSIEARGRTQ